jgi:hypothetical protein
MPDTHDTPVTDRRTELLRIAEQDLADIRASLTDLRGQRGRSDDELARITKDLRARRAALNAEISSLVGREADAVSLVKSLTPKAPRKRQPSGRVIPFDTDDNGNGNDED